jgi:hypothetical protein
MDLTDERGREAGGQVAERKSAQHCSEEKPVAHISSQTANGLNNGFHTHCQVVQQEWTETKP